MTILLLVRHGENDYLQKGILIGSRISTHLNEHGREQAEELAKALKEYPIKAIYSSPLERAVETAEPIASTHHLQIQPCPGLMDLDVGIWAGRSYKLLNRIKAWKIVQRAPSLFHFPEGESFLQAQERVVSELDAIIKAHPQAVVAVVFHADPIKLAIAHYIGLSFDNFQRLGVGAASVSILAVQEFGAALLAMNLTPPFSLPFKKGDRHPKNAVRRK